ncbi:DUF2840 domain-containing protein [uncultured Sphingorhabdus sp.]|uniref:DUF2840 domain-containing protein n=1 Tax=uncultured Sphingorhabdus sp. TaxID=1686106 RepID=UPI0026266A73|nr:DUF2840 domain-containing protein [uncultured Sphingorhabdus sp.]HMS20058.1 DUF2840 domain-containing protein [Sphingorhabdus sp.]
MLAPTALIADLQPAVAQQTHVELYWAEGQREHWLRFGAPVSDTILDRRRRKLTFGASQVFAFVRWASNNYGTIRSQIDIVRCVASGEPVTTLAGVNPGGDILLSVSGWPKVERAFKIIDSIEAAGIDPCAVAPDHWRHVHNRLAAAQAPRAYSPQRHRAWLQRKALLP